MSITEVLIMTVLEGFLLAGISLRLVQILQLSSYRTKGLFAWIKRTKFDYIVRYFALAFFCFTSMFVYVMCFSNRLSYIGFAFCVILCLYFIFAAAREKKKTPLKFTKRVIRLFIADVILNMGLSFVLIWFLRNTELLYSLVGVAPLLCPVTLILAHFVTLPLEKLIALSYINKARRKLSAARPIIIGITGSFGKTTTKNVLKRFLEKKYTVFASPSSFNTPMGLSRCVNEGYNGEQIFIAEMGARFTGDIAYLKKIFPPRYAIVTSIGNQHLETFGSKENIISEKLSILDGAEYAVANGDCAEIVANINQKAQLAGEVGDATYCDVKTSLDGTDFNLHLGAEKVDIHTRLVGEHVPVTIAMCALMANKLGLTLDEIAEAASDLPFVEHRLEVLNSGDIIILDDSYNSNPSGAKNALKILNTFDGTKVIITPGFVELGDDALKCLKELGENIAKTCDYAFLLGPNAEIIREGMGEAENVMIVENLDEAMQKLRDIPTPMAVLFENDLPDNY